MALDAPKIIDVYRALTLFLEPLTLTILAWLFFKEQLGLLGLLGELLLLGAIILSFRNNS